VTKVLIVGDTHGDAVFLKNLCHEATEQGATTIIQLGDFGFVFDHLNPIISWLDENDDHKFYWLDGNHDEHNYIEEWIVGDGDDNAPIPHFHDRLFYCPRGSVEQIGTKTCMFVGGAYSIDKQYRHENISWWPQEKIRLSDVLSAKKNADGRTIDVMFSHDRPGSEELLNMLHSHGYKVDPDSASNREHLEEVVEYVRPQNLYHGHYHYRYDTQYSTNQGWVVNVHGVGANIEGRWHVTEARLDKNCILVEW
jgi:predicted phosphodiesterase